MLFANYFAALILVMLFLSTQRTQEINITTKVQNDIPQSFVIVNTLSCNATWITEMTRVNSLIVLHSNNTYHYCNFYALIAVRYNKILSLSV